MSIAVCSSLRHVLAMFGINQLLGEAISSLKCMDFYIIEKMLDTEKSSTFSVTFFRAVLVLNNFNF